MSEEWRDSLLNFNNLEFQNLEKKILKNVGKNLEQSFILIDILRVFSQLYIFGFHRWEIFMATVRPYEEWKFWSYGRLSIFLRSNNMEMTLSKKRMENSLEI